MKKIHGSVLVIILFSLAIIAILGFISMKSNPHIDVPSNIIAVLSSLISLLIGYAAGKD